MKKTSPCMMLSVALAFTSLTANAGELVDPPVFTSNPVKQELDLLMVAKPASVQQFQASRVGHMRFASVNTA